MSNLAPSIGPVARIYRVWLSLLRRILHWWVRSTVVPEDLSELGIDPERPVFYVLDTYALTSLLIVEQICIRLGWPLPSAPSRTAIRP